MSQQTLEVQAKRVCLKHVIDALTNANNPILTVDDEVISSYLAELKKSNRCHNPAAVFNALEKRESAEDRKAILHCATMDLCRTYKITTDQLRDFVTKYLADCDGLRHFIRRTDLAPLTREALQPLADAMQMPAEIGLRELLSPLFEKEALALLGRRAINDYWFLRVLQQVPWPPFIHWPIEAYRVRIALYKVRASMYLPFGIMTYHKESGRPEVALPIALGALLLENEDGPSVGLQVNPVYSPAGSMQEYAVKYGAHGSPCRFDTPDRSVPKQPWMTFEEACAFAAHFCSTADTIGGDARVYHIPSGKETHEFWADHQMHAHWRKAE